MYQRTAIVSRPGSAEMHGPEQGKRRRDWQKLVKIADKWLSTSLQTKIFKNIVCIFM